MPEINDLKNSQCAFIYTDIGRGHPFYLDGIIECLDKYHPHIDYFKTDVFRSSRGICLIVWRLIRWLYRFGAKGGLITPVYSLARRFSGSSEGTGLMYRWLGRDLLKFLNGYDKPVIVAHPILAKILSRHLRVIYQHGELACPWEAIVRRCEKILVPRKGTADAMIRAAIPPEQIFVTGLCIENELLASADDALQKRLKRIDGDRPLTAALFSSGAYPAAHLQKLLCAARSLLEAGHNVVFFAGSSEKIASRFRDYLAGAGYNPDLWHGKSSRLKIILSLDRHEGNKQVAELADNLDLILAPAHERTNWALGLGMPFFMLCPHIGSYAPLNAAIARENGRAFEIPNTKEALYVGRILDDLRRKGRLHEMAQTGFGRLNINGFRHAADLIAELSQRKG